MPLTTEQRARLAELTGADASASDEVLSLAAADELDAIRSDVATVIPELRQKVLSLSAERDEAQSKLQEKEQQVLTLSADAPRRPDPVVAQMYQENFDQACETALESGVPKPAVDYFSSLMLAADGQPSPLMLSACSVPANDGKTKKSTLGIAVIQGLTKLAKAGFGTGVPTGIQTKPLLLSGDGDDWQEDAKAYGEAQAKRFNGEQPLSPTTVS